MLLPMPHRAKCTGLRRLLKLDLHNFDLLRICCEFVTQLVIQRNAYKSTTNRNMWNLGLLEY